MTPTEPDHPSHSFDEQLDAAYRRAHFVTPPETLRIGAPHPELDTWLRDRGHTTFAVLTACNPRSSLLPPAINADRHADLLEELRVRHLAFSPAAGRDPAGEWPEETAVLLLDAPAESRALGRQFGQNAIVEGELGGLARLVWL